LLRFACLAPVLVCLAALWAANPASAQENLDAGKTPAQLFASDCSVCHKSPKGLAKGTNSFSLSGFLRQHYTSSRQNASAIASYLISGAGRGERTKPAAASRKHTPEREKPATAGRKHTPAREKPAIASRTHTPPNERNTAASKRHAKPKTEEAGKPDAESAKHGKKPPEKKEEKKIEQAAKPAEKPVPEQKSDGEVKPATAVAAPKLLTSVAPKEHPTIGTSASGARIGESPGGPLQNAVPLAGAVPTRPAPPKRSDNIAD